MLQDVCEHIHNYFIAKDARKIPRCYSGDYSITSGVITPSVPLKEGQRFLIRGSDLNDGVYTWHAAGITNDDDDAVVGMSDEDFTGAVCALAVPPAVIALVSDIRDWVDKYGGIVINPYSSETVNGVYSYTKTVKSDDAGGGGYSWQDVFKDRLNQWRRPCL